MFLKTVDFLNFSGKNWYRKKLINIKSVFTLKKEEIPHFNRWLTDLIQDFFKSLSPKIAYLFKSFIPFSKMYPLFGLGTGYLLRIRMDSQSKQIISISKLEEMRNGLKIFIQNCINKDPVFSDELLEVQKKIIGIINKYQEILDPKPSPHYQMYNHHPNFKRDYFSIINTKEKAYWLGFLFADGYIALERKNSGDYYRMGFELSTSDQNILIKFCNELGLNPSYIRDRLSGSDFSSDNYPMSSIRWGDQRMAQNLIRLGMSYTYDFKKKQRIKIPFLPVLKTRSLMLSFIFGFFDGDGTLGYNVNTKRIYPSLACSKAEFLIQIKRFFDLPYQIIIKESERYNLRKKIMQKSINYELKLSAKLFEEMLINYKESMERKRVNLDFFDGYHERAEKFAPKRPWLKKKISRDILNKILKIISPSRIAKLLGVSHTTLIKLIKDYNIIQHKRGYYNKINRDLFLNRKKSIFFNSYTFWIDYIKKLKSNKEEKSFYS